MLLVLCATNNFNVVLCPVAPDPGDANGTARRCTSLCKVNYRLPSTPIDTGHVPYHLLTCAHCTAMEKIGAKTRHEQVYGHCGQAWPQYFVFIFIHHKGRENNKTNKLAEKTQLNLTKLIALRKHRFVALYGECICIIYHSINSRNHYQLRSFDKGPKMHGILFLPGIMR